MSVSPDLMTRETLPQPLLKRLRVWDWIWALLVAAGTAFCLLWYGERMDGYELSILFGAALTLIGCGWAWRALCWLSLAVAGLSLGALGLYGSELARGESVFLLRYLLASQSLIMWMSTLFVLATAAYLAYLARPAPFLGRVASGLTWTATGAGLAGLLVRWRETYLISPDAGYIPISNLYEVFILFCIITALLYLHYERRFRSRALGAFVLLVISAAVAFLLWYSFSRGAHEIQPLVPALQSYWMKIHVPANFVGYGCFAIAAMAGVAYLLRDWRARVRPQGLLATRLPSLELLDDVMYKSIALGFAFFTIATILGALWAAEAWGGYWSWDPKETWALIVWLNYAAWLHMRIAKGWQGPAMAWWSVVGLFITLFAFLGVNMFLSGLHSYGEL